MKKAEFLLEVKAELDNIKEKATKEEIDKLDINDFRHSSPTKCIYGQMTGHCQSDRAIQLVPKKYFGIGTDVSFSNQSYFIGNEFTSLEKYLYMVRKVTHEKIIAYLKGDIQEIILK